MKIFSPNKKGFTLVEEVVSIILIGILIAAASGIMINSMRLFGHYVISMNAQEKGIAVMEQLEGHIRYASKITSDESLATGTYVVKLAVQENDGTYTFKAGDNTLCNLGGFDVKCTFTPDSSAGTVKADLDVYRYGTVYYSDSHTIKVKNSTAVAFSGECTLDSGIYIVNLE